MTTTPRAGSSCAHQRYPASRVPSEASTGKGIGSIVVTVELLAPKARDDAPVGEVSGASSRAASGRLRTSLVVVLASPELEPAHVHVGLVLGEGLERTGGGVPVELLEDVAPPVTRPADQAHRLVGHVRGVLGGEHLGHSDQRRPHARVPLVVFAFDDLPAGGLDHPAGELRPVGDLTDTVLDVADVTGAKVGADVGGEDRARVLLPQDFPGL